jgi:hypothetical protein
VAIGCLGATCDARPPELIRPDSAGSGHRGRCRSYSRSPARMDLRPDDCSLRCLYSALLQGAPTPWTSPLCASSLISHATIGAPQADHIALAGLEPRHTSRLRLGLLLPQSRPSSASIDRSRTRAKTLASWSLPLSNRCAGAKISVGARRNYKMSSRVINGSPQLSCYNVANRCSAAFKSVVSKPSTNCSNIGCKIALARSRCP